MLAGFVGRIRQTPPVYSAIKRDGVPLYKLARQGEQVDVPEREVEIDRIDVLAYSPEALDIDVVCGSGTYIRSLGVDIGRALGSAAHLSALRRLWVSPFESRPMVELGALNDADDPGVHVFAVDQAMPQFPPIVLADPEYAELCFGRRVADRAEVDGRYRLYADAAGFVGLGRVDHGILRADRLMATA